MPNASTTQTSSASDTTGTPVPLAYGYQWATGKRAEYYMTQNTNNEYTDYWRAGIWLLGHGEWDGCLELWINDVLIWQSENDDPSQFHFHRGSDATMNTPLTPTSLGPDQGVDNIFGVFPPAINPLNYNRIAYYTIFRKQLIENPTNDNQGDPTQWADIAPIGLWRALRVRLFDDQGNTTGYAFSTNPAWHFVDVLLRRKIMPEWNIDLTNGPTDLTDAVRARFDWGTIYKSAQYFDQILSNGRRRFTGNYAFATQTTLQAVLEQILLCCRSFSSEYGGKISLNCDMPRSSVFTFSRKHVLPGSWEASDATLHTTANRFLAHFRDLLIPQASYIESITCANHAEPQVTTQEPHPFETGDRIAIGGTDTVYDGEWVVDVVPATINPGTITEIDPTTFSMISKGSNYPASIGAVGGIGLMYSRFENRVPEFWHKTNMMARGTIGLGIPRQRNKVKQSLDYATTTWDQASRLTCYERDRLLGLDQTPYVTPPNVKLRTSLFAKDVNGNLACAIRPGDHVTIDDTANYQYAGEYEVLEPLTVYPPSSQQSGNAIAQTPAENSGEIEFALGPYNEAVMYDTSDPTQAGWPSVEGSDPGNDSNYTGVALANGGTFVFFTGALPSGQTWQLPSTGFPAGNVLAWAGPQGYKEYGHPMQDILLCDPGLPTRQLKLQYVDGNGNIWPGDVNYAALSWLSPDTTYVENGITWVEFTLLGGEVVLFGQGVVADSTTLVLPVGFTTAQMFAVAYPHDAPPGSNGNDAHWVGAAVSSTGEVTLDYKDGEGHVWHGNAAVLVFAWKNNMGTMVTETTTATTGTLANWVHCPQPNGSVFGVGCALGFPNGAVLQIPQDLGDTTVIEASLEAIVGSSGWNYPDNGHPTHGVGACYLDANNVVNIMFEDGEGHEWYGAADVFALFCTPALPPPTQISVGPTSISVPANFTVLYTAYVTYNTNPDVTWAVDGIAGGNATVGTISPTGAYLSPNASGYHIITATSVAAPTVSGSAAVTVQAGGSIPTLDQIPDGTIYARPKQSALLTGLVDLSLVGVTGKTATNIEYSAGGTVDSLMPAQAGADVTAQNANILLQNPNFAAGNTGWTLQSGWSIAANPGALYGSGYVGEFNSATSTSSSLINAQSIPCGAGSVLSGACSIQPAASALGGVSIFFNFYNASGSQVGATQFGNLVSTIGSWGQSRVVATAPTGAAYAIVGVYSGSSTGQWFFAAFSASILPNSVDEVPDGTIYTRMPGANMDINRRGYIDFTQSGHIGKSAVNIPYTSGATVESLQPAEVGADVTGTNTSANALALGSVAAGSITPIAGLMPAQVGADVTAQNADILLQNPNFAAGNVGWTLQSGWSIALNGGALNGSGYVGIFDSASALNDSIFNNQRIPCAPGAVLSALCSIQAGSGTAGSLAIFINFYDAGATQVGSTSLGNAASTVGAWSPSRVVATAPATTAYALVGVYGGSATGEWFVAAFSASILPNSVDEVPDGATYARLKAIAMTSGQVDLSLAGVINKTAGYIAYGSGATVESLQPAEVGANVTGTNTSLDTTNVNGVASSSISPIGALMPGEVGADKTLNHVFTTQTNGPASQVSGTSNLTLIVFDVTSNGPGDVFTLFANVTASFGDGVVASIVGNADGTTQFGYGQFVSQSSTNLQVGGYVGSVTGLAAGAHTISLILNCGSTITVNAGEAGALLQQISS